MILTKDVNVSTQLRQYYRCSPGHDRWVIRLQAVGLDDVELVLKASTMTIQNILDSDGQEMRKQNKSSTASV